MQNSLRHDKRTFWHLVSFHAVRFCCFQANFTRMWFWQSDVNMTADIRCSACKIYWLYFTVNHKNPYFQKYNFAGFLKLIVTHEQLSTLFWRSEFVGKLVTWRYRQITKPHIKRVLTGMRRQWTTGGDRSMPQIVGYDITTVAQQYIMSNGGWSASVFAFGLQQRHPISVENDTIIQCNSTVRGFRYIHFKITFQNSFFGHCF